jgi:ribosomal protein S18 acetylase RimI-like enzyme
VTDGRLEFEPFDRARHQRERFDCGVTALNDYLRTKLGQHSKKSLTRGYVLAAQDGRIAGYFTLAASRLAVSVIPDGHGYPARMPLPTTLLGRLAVDNDFKGRGLGAMLLVHALRVAVQGSENIGSAAIEVDAKDDAARAFYAKYGFQSLLDDRLHMYMAMETAREVVGR